MTFSHYHMCYNKSFIPVYQYIAMLGKIVNHCSDVMIDAMASQITSLTTVYSTVYSGADQRKTSKLRVIGLQRINGISKIIPQTYIRSYIVFKK